MKIRYLGMTFIFIFLSIHPVFAQGDLSKVQIKTTHIGGNIYMLEGQGGNMGASVGKDGIVLIDDQFAPLSDKILKALKDIKDVPVKFVINTHWHGDHTGGNEAFGSFATIIAHENVRKRLSEQQFIELFNSVRDPSPKGALPVITFTQGVSLHFNDEEIKVIHFPKGHTDGDSVIFFTKSNVVHLGDHFFSETFPFVDLSSGGDVEGFIENVKRLIDEIPDDARLIPGHGPSSGKEGLKGYYNMLVETTAIVREKIDEGKSLEEIQKEGLPEPWRSWESSFIKTADWIGIITKSLVKNK